MRDIFVKTIEGSCGKKGCDAGDAPLDKWNDPMHPYYLKVISDNDFHDFMHRVVSCDLESKAISSVE